MASGRRACAWVENMTDHLTSNELRMDAYYYSFESTGVPEIDLILSAVACAGKAYHHTMCWQDECEWEPHEGKAPVDWIYNAAVRAAEEIKKLRQRERHADEPSLSHFAVLSICEAYESGVGMGLRDDSKAPNMANPYKQGTPEYEAYAIGEDKGRTMERPAEPPSAWRAIETAPTHQCEFCENPL